MAERQPPADSQSAAERVNDIADQGRQTAEEAYGKVTDERPSMPSSVSDALDSAKSSVEEQRTRAAESMAAAAGQIRERAEQIPGGERTTEMANLAAEKMDEAAGFLRSADMQSLSSQFERMVRDHPTGAMLAAAAVGLLVGRALPR